MGYKTVKEYSSDEFVERKSRFIGHICPVKTEKEAVEFVEKISKENYSAAHNVYAYRLRDKNIERFSDNGEPQGTAGIPVLDVIKKENITDVCVVVTRYFGGIMLGGGGLVRAYSHSAKIAVDSAEILNMQECLKINTNFEYSFYGKFKNVAPLYNVKELNSNFFENISLELLVEEVRYDEFKKEVEELSNGRIELNIVDKLFYNIN